MEISNYCVCCKGTSLKRYPAILMPFVAYRVFGWQPVEITDDWNLRTVKNGMAYTVCNSIQCNRCGLLFLDIRFNDREMESLYADYGGKKYTEIRQRYEFDYIQQNDNLNTGIGYVSDIEKFLIPYLKLPVSILDWGGLVGENTPFKESSKLFHIYDISNKPVNHGAKAIDKATASNNKYDLIICANVLEHVPYPIELILDIKKSMARCTVLYIEIPCEGITDKKRYWHEHINIYTEKSLKAILSICGLKILNIKLMDGSAGPGKANLLYRIACKLK